MFRCPSSAARSLDRLRRSLQRPRLADRRSGCCRGRRPGDRDQRRQYGDVDDLTVTKRTAPREVWDVPAFVDANIVITAVWAASFTLTALVCATTLAVAPGATPS